MANIITGLDIGTAQIKGVVAEVQKNGKLSVLAVVKQPSAGIRRGVLVDQDDFTVVMRDLIADLQKISRQATRNLFINVQSEHIKVRNSRGMTAVARADREIQQDDVEKAVSNARAGKAQPNFMVLHNIIREFFVDDVGDIHDALGMTGSRLEVSTLIVEAFTPQVDILLKSLQKAGGEVGGLIFNPLAAGRSALTKRQRDLGTLMIDFGFGTTSFVAYEEGKVLHAKTLPIGSGLVTNDIAIGLKLPIDAAEKLKLMHGFALAKEVSRKEVVRLSEFDPANKSEITQRFLAEIIEVRLAELLELVNNELKTLGRNVQFPGGVVVTGGGVKMAGLPELTRQELKLAVQIGYPNLEFFEILNPAHKEMLDDPEMATATGLVIWGHEQGDRPTMSLGPQGIKNFFKNLLP